MAQTLRPSKAPNLPIAPVDYSQQYVDQLTNAFRLYFSQVDNFSGGLMQNNGGRFINFPHIAASDSTNQYALGDNTPTIVAWNTLEVAGGFTLNAPGSATATYNGIYKIDYSLQFANTNNDIHNAVVWLQVDGVALPDSATEFTLAARKSAGVPSYLCAYSHVTFEIIGGSVIELVWATDKAYSTTGPVNGIYMIAKTAQTVPYVRPSIPSAIGSIVFVSELDQ